MMKFNRKWLYQVCLICMMVVIFIFSHQPGKVSAKVSNAVANTLQIEQQNEYVAVSAQPLFAGLSLRKYAHIILYFLLGVSAVLAIKDCQHKWYLRLVFALAICFIYSCSDELHQMFVPGRAASVRDLCVDAIGYGVAIVGMFAVRAGLDGKIREWVISFGKLVIRSVQKCIQRLGKRGQTPVNGR